MGSSVTVVEMIEFHFFEKAISRRIHCDDDVVRERAPGDLAS